MFGDPEPLAAPTLSGDYCQVTGADAATDPERVVSDRRVLLTLLGRA